MASARRASSPPEAIDPNGAKLAPARLEIFHRARIVGRLISGDAGEKPLCIGFGIQFYPVGAGRPLAGLRGQLDGDAEAGLAELQRGELGLDGGGQLAGGLAAGCGQSGGGGDPGVAGGAGFGPGFDQGVLGPLDLRQAGGDRRPSGRQGLDLDPQLSRRAPQGEEPFFGSLQAPGLEIEGLGGGVDGGGGLGGLDERAVHGFGGGRQPHRRCRSLVEAGGERPLTPPLEGAIGLAQPAGQAVGRQGVAGGGDLGQRPLAGAEHGPLFGQQGLLALARAQAIELGQALGCFSAFGVRRAGDGFGGGEPALGGFPRGPGGAARLQQVREAAESVEQRPVGARIQQADGLVLAMDLDQEVSHLAQGGDARRLVIAHRMIEARHRVARR